MSSRYTQAMLTIIAAALVIGIAQRAIAPAEAQPAACGSDRNPCIVLLATWDKVQNRAVLCSEQRQPCLSVLTKPGL